MLNEIVLRELEFMRWQCQELKNNTVPEEEVYERLRLILTSARWAIDAYDKENAIRG